jgi:hypothetical protein
MYSASRIFSWGIRDPEDSGRICKRLYSPGIDSEESARLAYVLNVAARAGTTNRVVVPASPAGNSFLGSLKVYKNGLCGHMKET